MPALSVLFQSLCRSMQRHHATQVIQEELWSHLHVTPTAEPTQKQKAFGWARVSHVSVRHSGGQSNTIKRAAIRFATRTFLGSAGIVSFYERSCDMQPQR